MKNDYEKHLLKHTKAELAKLIMRLQDELDISGDIFDQFITYATVMQEDKNYCLEHACGMCKFDHFCKMCKARAWFLYQKKGVSPCKYTPSDEFKMTVFDYVPIYNVTSLGVQDVLPTEDDCDKN